MSRKLLLISTLVALSCRVVAADKVDIQLTYPIGKSPKVFQVGWTFGAKAVVDPGTGKKRDISSQVRWSGTGVFSPTYGAVSHPAFAGAGDNTIELSVKVGGKTYSEKFRVAVVKTAGYATLGDKAFCPADAHGCPGCPHPVIGPITSTRSKVRINGKPVACVGDTGIHHACCDSNTFRIVSGDNNVLIEGRPAARKGDKTQHCGGVGKIVEGSVTIPTKFTGAFSGSASGKATFTLEPGSAEGHFGGSHSTEGGGSANVDLKGTYNPRNGLATGTISGIATYVGLNNKRATARVSGTFTGRTKGNAFSGTWKGKAVGLSTVPVSGSFKGTRAAVK